MEAKSEGDGLPQTEEDWSKLEEEAKTLREKMDEMGPVNTEAISEYDELENRLKFLETEEKDLTTAKAQLEEAIRKINQTRVSCLRKRLIKFGLVSGLSLESFLVVVALPSR